MTTILRSIIKGGTLGALAFVLAVGPAFAGGGSSGGSSGGGFMHKHKSAGSSGGSNGGSMGGFMHKHKSAG